MYKTHLHNVVSAIKTRTVLFADGVVKNNDFDSFVTKISEHYGKAICFDMGSINEMVECPTQYKTFNLPYPVCWLEFVLDNGDIRGYMAAQDDKESGDKVSFMQFEKHKGESLWRLSGLLAVWMVGNQMVRVKTEPERFEASGQANAIRNVLQNFLGLMMVPGIKPIEIKPSNKLQRKRRKRGKLPIFSTWTLNINLPKTAKTEFSREGSSDKRMRLHLKRGHMRRVNKQGLVRYIDPYLAGDKKLGVIHKDYSARYKN